jgi:hypothetical protein
VRFHTHNVFMPSLRHKARTLRMPRLKLVIVTFHARQAAQHSAWTVKEMHACRLCSRCHKQTCAGCSAASGCRCRGSTQSLHACELQELSGHYMAGFRARCSSNEVVDLNM